MQKNDPIRGRNRIFGLAEYRRSVQGVLNPLADKRAFIVMLCCVFTVFHAEAFGRKEGTDQRPGSGRQSAAEEILKIHGRVRLVGSMPFPNLVITDVEDHDWYVEDADRELLKTHEQRIITVEGRPEYEDLVLANGENIGRRRYLRNIRIIEAE
jgi:hypothetical protein